MGAFDPFKSPGSTTAKVWGAMLARLQEADDWLSFSEVVAAGEKTGAHRKTVVNRLDDAIAYGVVARHGTYNRRTQKDWRRYRLQSKWFVHPNARQWFGPYEGRCIQSGHTHVGDVEGYRLTSPKGKVVDAWLCEAGYDIAKGKYTVEKLT